ncbi:MAG: site-2 protease family protein [Anaerolineae bacterium]
MLFGAPTLATLIANAIALLLAITIHEFAHAWMANELGDPTAKNRGRLTLNPLSHLDPVGTLMILIARFGWGKPVPVNPYNLRNGPRTGGAMVALAGPLSNLALASALAVPIRFGVVEMSFFGGGIPSPGLIVGTALLLNVVLAVFNLLPIAPLDGFRIAVGFLPSRWAYSLAQTERYGPLILFALIAFGYTGIPIFAAIIGPVIGFIITLLVGGV